MTAAEIAAAEAAAAQAAAAAEAAAIAEAAQAAEVARQAAQATEAAQALQASQTANSGIQTLAQEVAAKPPAGIEQITQAFQNVNPPPMSQAEFLNNSLAGGNTPFNPVTGANAPLSPLTPVSVVAPPAPPPIPQVPAFDPAQYLQSTMPGSVPGATPPLPPSVPAIAPPAPASPLDYGFSRPDMGGAGGVQQGFGGTGMQAQLTPEQLAGPNQYSVNQGLNYQSPISASVNTPPTPAPSGIEGLFNKGVDYVKQNPLTALMGANSLYNALNKPEPEEKKKYKSTFKSNLYTGYDPVQPTPYQPQYAVGGLADLGGYSDGGRMLKGPGDGMSDDIPATIAGKQPARLANEEFVIPADVVSHLGNGSSEAGAKQLYKMMDRIRKARTGTKKQGKQINPDKYLA
jgi:hypothetical protein